MQKYDCAQSRPTCQLIMVDYYSNLWEINQLACISATTVITKLKNHFARYGCPSTVVSDNGPRFSPREFAHFSKTWKFKHRTISAGNIKSNGKAEAAVKTAKQLLRKSRVLQLALLDHRNTHTQGMSTSRAQRLMSRRTRTLVPQRQLFYSPKHQTRKNNNACCANDKKLSPVTTTGLLKTCPNYRLVMWFG